MKNLYKPYLFLLTITVPQGILILLFSRMFFRIHSQLPPESIHTWTLLGVYLTLSWTVCTLYGIVSWIKKRDITLYGVAGVFLVHIVFTVLYFFKFSMVIPANIPNWMFLGVRPGMYTLTALMPILVHTMVMLVHGTMERYQMNPRVKDVYFLIGIPVCWYMFGRFMILLKGGSFRVLIPIIFVVSMVTFMFFFARIIFTVLKQKPEMWQKYLSPGIFLGSILGLSLNQSLGNILGDFSHPVFYILAFTTGIFMMIPPGKDKRIRLALFVGKGITFIFTLYFFMVFLPYLPLAFIGIIIIGLGILMLVPLGLLFLHARSLWWDFDFLKVYYDQRVLVLTFILCLSIIPSFFMMIISGDKQSLDDALTYTYQRGFEEEKSTELDIPGIQRTLKNIKYMKGASTDRLGLFNTKTPYLTALYNQYVLDNLTLSNDKINELEAIFLGQPHVFVDNEGDMDGKDQNVIIKDVKSDTIFDAKEGVYKSWVDFEIVNNNAFQSEYSTVFELPEGSYITNYYLYVGDQKKYGLMADERAANWVYQQIKNVRRDPGILTHIGGDKIAFRVFPLNDREIRKTGIEITHRMPLTVSIDGRKIDLMDHQKDGKMGYKEPISYPGVEYIPKETKKTLPKVMRKPKYYFILDYSNGNEANIDEYGNRINDYIKEKNIESDVEEIIGLNYVEQRGNPNENWEEDFKKIKVQGGFYLDYTIKRILYDHYVDPKDEYPVMVVVTNDQQNKVLSKNFDDFGFLSPEGLYFYYLDQDGELQKYALDSKETKKIDKIEVPPVLAWKNPQQKTIYLPDNQQDSIIITDQLALTEKDVTGSKWERGVALKAMYMDQQLHPEESFEKSLAIVKGSIKNHVMSPLTSFIVLENEAQEKVMLEKQQKILSSEKPLDIGDLTEMDEPSLVIVAFLGLGLALLIKIYRRHPFMKG